MMTNCKKRNSKNDMTVDWYFGRTGTGKSRRVFEEYPDAYVKCGGNDWWDHYAGEKTVIFDDFRGDWFKFSTLLTLLDRYPTKVPFKGGICEMSATHFVITCSKRPEELFCNTKGERLDQLIRRISTITEVHGPGDTTVLKNERIVYDVLDIDVPFVNTFNAPS